MLFHSATSDLKPVLAQRQKGMHANPTAYIGGVLKLHFPLCKNTGLENVYIVNILCHCYTTMQLQTLLIVGGMQLKCWACLPALAGLQKIICTPFLLSSRVKL